MTPLLPSVVQQHLARVIDSSDDAIISKDLDGTITSWNRAAERMFGYSNAEAVGRSIRMIVPADRQREEDLVLAKITRGEVVSHFETVRLRKDGTSIDISLTVSPIHDDSGRIIGASKIARDIGDRRRADAATRRLAAIIESSDDAILTKDLNGTITSWNRAAERMFGYTAAEALGRSIRMLIPADRQAEEDAVLASIRAGDTVDHFETVRRHKDGSLLTIALTVSPLRNDRGEIIGASKIARDTTALTRLLDVARGHAAVAEKLQQAGEVLASSLDRETLAQRITDIATELTTAECGAFFSNATDHPSLDGSWLCALSGASREVFADFQQPQRTAMFAPTFRGEPPVRVNDVTRTHRFGPNAPVIESPERHLPIHSYLAVPVFGRGGEVLGGLFFGHSAVGVFSEQHERLAVGVAGWATVALENARLYVDLQEANRLKDEFLAMFSHELRTPLNAIVGYARLLRSGMLDADKARAGLEAVDRNAASLTQMIEDVLDVSRIISGKLRIDVQPVDLALVVHHAVSTVQPMADAKGVHLHATVSPTAELVAGDRDRLQQIVWNLLSNAVKFTPRGGRVAVNVRRADSDIEVVVTDTGIGIPREFLAHVFERFAQADHGMRRRTGGLGLGLAIVRHLVELHGGTVTASSPGANEGATFTIRLPVIVGRRSAARAPHADLEPLAELGDLRGIRALAVDDEPDALGLLKTVLEKAGGRVTTVASAAEVLRDIGEIKPDVLLLDLGMPEMDGLDLIRRIRDLPDPQLRRTPAAALTAFARPQDRTNALQAGFDVHLAKPVDPGELVAAIAMLVRRGRA